MRRCEFERDRDLERARSFFVSGVRERDRDRDRERRLPSFPSNSFSELRRTRSFDFGRSFVSFTAVLEAMLLLRDRVRDFCFSRRWSLLDDDDELDDDDDELLELDLDPELCDDELLSEELIRILNEFFFID